MKKPVVLNLSVGGDYGSHDGKSALEEGLSAFVGDDKPGHAIVIAAGNQRLAPRVGRRQGRVRDPHRGARVGARRGDARAHLRDAAREGRAGFVWITVPARRRGAGRAFEGLRAAGGSAWSSPETTPVAGAPATTARRPAPSSTGSRTGSRPSPQRRTAPSWPSAGMEGGRVRDPPARPRGRAALGDGARRRLAVARPRASCSRAPSSKGRSTCPRATLGCFAVGCTINRVRWQPLGELHERAPHEPRRRGHRGGQRLLLQRGRSHAVRCGCRRSARPAVWSRPPWGAASTRAPIPEGCSMPGCPRRRALLRRRRLPRDRVRGRPWRRRRSQGRSRSSSRSTRT